MMMVLSRYIVTCLLAIVLALHKAEAASAADDKEAQLTLTDILNKATKSFEQLNYEALMIYNHDGVMESMRLIHGSNGSDEYEQLTYLNGPQREIFRSNETVICQFKGQKPFIATRQNRRAYSSNPILDKIRHVNPNYRYMLVGNERIAERQAYVIEIRSADRLRYGYRFWIDKKSSLVLRADVISPANRIIEQFLVVGLQIKDAIDLSEFNTDLLKVAEQALIDNKVEQLVARPGLQSQVRDGERWKVTWLPKGFQLRSNELKGDDPKGVDTHLLYTDGVAAISVYITEAKKMPNGPIRNSTKVMRKGSFTYYDLIKSDYQVTVLGDIPIDTAKKIAGSVIDSNK